MLDPATDPELPPEDRVRRAAAAALPASLDAQLARLLAWSGQFDERMTERLDTVSERLDRQEGCFDEVRRVQNDCAKRQVSHQAALEQHHDEIDKLNRLVRDGNGNPSLLSRVDHISSVQDHERHTLAGISTRLDHLQATVDSIARHGSDHSRRVGEQLAAHLQDERKAVELAAQGRASLWVAVVAAALGGVVGPLVTAAIVLTGNK